MKVKQAMQTAIYLVIILSKALFSCSGNHGRNNTFAEDSSQIQEVLRNMYEWHETINQNFGFDVIVEDTLQTGLDTTKLAGYIADLNTTDLFASDFLSNYRRIVQKTDYQLRFDTVKYYNEINFGFQDADPWTFYQDTFGSYWDRLIISNLKINADTASLTWTEDNRTFKDGYKVKLKRENKKWKVSYLEGFDTSCCW